MPRCVLLAFFAAIALPSFAKQVTVDQLDQILAATRGKGDAEIARRLTDIELTQRPTQATLLRWQTDYPGAETRKALALIADSASFLDLPPTEIPPTPTPDHAEQRRIMGLTVDYVTKTIHQLPNFFATRVTTRYEDAPGGYAKGGTLFVPAQPLFLAGNSRATVIYRDGAEILDTASAKKPAAPLHGLTTSGEFGPILATVLVDAAHGTLGWGHWEPGPAGPLAIFRYSVPREKSQYEVSYCCIVPPGRSSVDRQPFRQVVQYHGEIAIDPATGAILRITVQADLKRTDPLTRTDIMVEYGPVQIGGQSYVCPLRSVSISVGQAVETPEIQNLRIATTIGNVQYSPGNLQTLLNEIRFVDYHLFHANATMVAASAELPNNHPGSPEPPTPFATASPASIPPATAAPAPAPDAATTTAAATAETPWPPTSTPPSGASAPPPAPDPPAASSPEPDFDVPSLSARNQAQVPVFKASSEAVVVDVVVTRGRDEPVTGLSKDDFQVTEDGKPQPLNFFEEHNPGNAPPAPLPQMPPNVFTNQPAAPPGDSVDVLLLDSLNTDREDQAYVHQQILNYLKTMEPGTQVAIFTLSSKLRMIQGFSTDSSALQAALNDPKSGALTTRTAMSRSLQDKLDDQNEIGTLEAVQMSGSGIEAMQTSQANHAAYQQDQRVSMTLQAMDYIARYLSGIPGRKNLIWFSSSFPISIFPNSKERLSPDAERQFGPAIRQTADLLTLSKIAVYPVGAEGIITEHPMEASNVAAVNTEGVSADNRMGASTAQRPGDPMVPYADEHGARAAKMQAMEQLAADTGGEAIFNANDLNKAIKRVVQNGSHYYTLVYTPTNKEMDGKYRRIEVKLAAGKYKLSYRRGYYADTAAQEQTDAGDSVRDADPLRPLLARGMPSATQLLYGVRVLPATHQPNAGAPPAGGNASLIAPLTRYSVDFLIRWTDVDLQLTPQGNHGGRIQLGVIAYSRDGKPVNWVGTTQTMNINPATFAAIQRSGVPAHIEIDLPQQDLYLATGVYDWASKKAGTLEIPLQVQSPTAPAATPLKPN